jgi:hypothetical protein
MRYAHSSRRLAAGCLVAVGLLVALSCAGVSAWLKTGTQPVLIGLGPVSVLITPWYVLSTESDMVIGPWTIGIDTATDYRSCSGGRYQLGVADVVMWFCP